MSKGSRIFILTSCTGQKAVEDPTHLTLEDFRRGHVHIRERERVLNDKLTPAENLYSGMQHVRLMRGVQVARNARMDIDLKIVSAGYGVIEPERKIAPYEATFIGMGKAALRQWAHQLGIPSDVRSALAAPSDLALMLLGDDYLTACELGDKIKLGGPTLALCGRASAAKLPKLPNLHPILLSNADTKRFSCGLVGLKGEVAARLLEIIAVDRKRLAAFVSNPQGAVADLATSNGNSSAKGSRPQTRANVGVDRVIEIPQTWWDKPHRRQLRYFIPEWDDLVDPDYDFAADTHSGGTGDWSNEVYAHQIYPEPNYDGILVSRAVAEKSKKKDARINAMGVHRFLRVPRNFPIMGDCGAFDYIEQKSPPYKTEDVIDYYTRLDFDFGSSVDHLIVPAFYADKQFRYQLTVQNAEDFLKEHRKRDLSWEPIGSVQGWDPKSYADAVSAYIKMGYRSLALGGLVRCSTKEIVQILRDVKPRLRPGIGLHLFGIARPEALPTFASMGVTSVDSASHLRRAWLIARDNYFTLDGNSYSAIRIPEVGKSFRTKRMVAEGKASESELRKLQARAMQAVIAVDRGQMKVSEAVKLIDAYDRLIGEGRNSMREEYRRTLEETPWKVCPCDICKRYGVQVMVFRGNNRNRRRGFHNTYVFYRLMQRAVLNGAPAPLEGPQRDLFHAEGLTDHGLRFP
jgi:queuine/archaeosine tRNA-ribosyltransferase